MSEIVWASLDPILNRVDIYPKKFGLEIEKAWIEREPNQLSVRVLGANFYNASINFWNDLIYQTTPEINYRNSFKYPGYRSVKRCQIVNGTITIYTKYERGKGWRITDSEFGSFKLITPISNQNDIISDNLYQDISINTWKPEDLSSQSDDLVIIWQWCVHTHGDISNFPGNSWRPYNSSINNLIEQSYNNNLISTTIELPLIGQRNISFNSNDCYAKQSTLDQTKIRIIRRIVKTMKELNTIFERIAKLPENYDEIVKHIPYDEVPEHYYCPILQEIMKDPVKTIDGFTYERSAIETWFTHRISSPLTGLELSSSTLISNTELANLIADFIKTRFQIQLLE